MASDAVNPDPQCSSWRSIQDWASDSAYGVGIDAVHLTISGSWHARVTSGTSSNVKRRSETTPSESGDSKSGNGLISRFFSNTDRAAGRDRGR
jgi:hypothetical protein